MAKIGRNEPCLCGSGRKAKRCCGVQRGPDEDQLDRAFIAAEASAAASWFRHLDDDELDDLWEEMLELPAHHLTLHFPLPRIVTPELERLFETISNEEPDEAYDDALDDALDDLDTPAARAVLARAVIALRDNRLLEPRLAAIAILDLVSRSRGLVGASLAEASALAAGVVRTPGGLIVAQSLAA
jgi:hypothetical protein